MTKRVHFEMTPIDADKAYDTSSRPTPSPVEVCVKCGEALHHPKHGYDGGGRLDELHFFVPPAPAPAGNWIPRSVAKELVTETMSAPAAQKECGVFNPGGQPCTMDKGHPSDHDPAAYGPPAAQPASPRSAQRELNDAVMYALKEGCFFPVSEPKAGATTQELIQWGAMRHLHDAIARFNREPTSRQAGERQSELEECLQVENDSLRAELGQVYAREVRDSKPSTAESELATIKTIFEWFTKKIDAISLDGDRPEDEMAAFREIISTCKRTKGMIRLSVPATAVPAVQPANSRERICVGCNLPVSLHGVEVKENWGCELAKLRASHLEGEQDSPGLLLRKIVEICDSGSAQEFGDADERLRAIRGLIVAEAGQGDRRAEEIAMRGIQAGLKRRDTNAYRAGVAACVAVIKAEVLDNPKEWNTRAYWNAALQKCLTNLESITDSPSPVAAQLEEDHELYQHELAAQEQEGEPLIWLCSCGDHNDRERKVCRRCGLSKPVRTE